MTEPRNKRNISEERERLTTADLAGAGEPEQKYSTGQRIHIAPPAVGTLDSSPIPEAPMQEIEAEQNMPHAGVVESEVTHASASAGMRSDASAPLFTSAEAKELRSRWDAIQVGFVDEPRRAVERADNLVAGAMKRLAEIFSEERERLEKQWDRGEDISTEDLRLALQRYRSFFGRLLAV